MTTAPEQTRATLMQGRVCVVTGATAGIGKEIARCLHAAGATVVVPCRSMARGAAAARDIGGEGSPPRVELLEADLASQRDVRALAEELTRRHPRIDVLVNNAGVWMTERRTTVDGIETTWATNVLAYFLLTRLLETTLRASAPARVVNVASRMAWGLDLDDVEWSRRPYRGAAAYAQSKQADRMLSWSLAQRLDNSGVTVNAMHPGPIRTELFRHHRGSPMGLAIAVYQRIAGKSVRAGADTAVWLASSPEVDGRSGEYWLERRSHPCRFREPTQLRALWELCERMTGLA